MIKKYVVQKKQGNSTNKKLCVPYQSPCSKYSFEYNSKLCDQACTLIKSLQNFESLIIYISLYKKKDNKYWK